AESWQRLRCCLRSVAGIGPRKNRERRPATVDGEYHFLVFPYLVVALPFPGERPELRLLPAPVRLRQVSSSFLVSDNVVPSLRIPTSGGLVPVRHLRAGPDRRTELSRARLRLLQEQVQ